MTLAVDQDYSGSAAAADERWDYADDSQQEDLAAEVVRENGSVSVAYSYYGRCVHLEEAPSYLRRNFIHTGYYIGALRDGSSRTPLGWVLPCNFEIVSQDSGCDSANQAETCETTKFPPMPGRLPTISCVARDRTCLTLAAQLACIEYVTAAVSRIQRPLLTLGNVGTERCWESLQLRKGNVQSLVSLHRSA